MPVHIANLLISVLPSVSIKLDAATVCAESTTDKYGKYKQNPRSLYLLHLAIDVRSSIRFEFNLFCLRGKY
jgi:hypothetical protein